MYRTCIFCSAPLGANEAVEAFPVGRSVAFDAAKGRLWAVCRKCGRWNLAPLEERWEAVEEAERAFRDTRIRVQSENVGLAKLRDGTRLIRVGTALAGELAAWRYGDQLVRRRNQYLLVAAAGTATGLLLIGGFVAAGVGGGLGGLWSVAGSLWQERENRKVIHRVPAGESPTGAELAIRRWHVFGAQLQPSDTGAVQLVVPDVSREKAKADGWGRPKYGTADPVVLPDAHARTVLGRAMVHVNAKGASRGRVRDAVALLEKAPSPEEYLRDAARRQGVLGRRKGMERMQLAPAASLALEMALHEESERRALQGELAALEAAWRQAEEIAAIADRLPDLPPPESPGIVDG